MLSKYKPTHQSSTLKASSLANDGLIGTCAQMEKIELNWWEVDLLDVCVVSFVVVMLPNGKCVCIHCCILKALTLITFI